jgi:hypothetical protein
VIGFALMRGILGLGVDVDGEGRARAVHRACATALIAIALAGCHDEDWLQYSWDDRRIVCSHTLDDITQDAPWGRIRDQLETARRRGSAALLHAHIPHVTISPARLLAVLDLADRLGLAYVTYGDFTPGAPPRPGLALAFDDHAIGAWFEQRELFLERGVRVTFFVSAYFQATDEERAMLAQLAADGHSIQAHSVRHLDPRRYVAAHGLQAYLADEALPSIELLREAGYAPTAYAYPFGLNSDALDEAMLQHVERVRVGPRPCPY